MGNYILMWIAVVVVCVIIEVATVGLATIWFAAGAVFSLVAALLNAPLWLQLVVFFSTSGLLLYFTRPILVDKLKIGQAKTNVDKLIGETALVIEDIREFGTGIVKVNGQFWTALADYPKNISKGHKVIIERVEGVKLIVSILDDATD